MRFHYALFNFLPSIFLLLCLGCSGSSSDDPVLTVEMPVHLEDRLAAAAIEGSEIPGNIPKTVEWGSDELESVWSSDRLPVRLRPVRTFTGDALRLSVDERNRSANNLVGAIYVELPDWDREDWGHVLVRARASEKSRRMGLAFNLIPDADSQGRSFRFTGKSADLVNDGSVQSYLLRADWSPQWEGPWQGPLRQLAIWFHAEAEAEMEILSVSLIPKEADYAAFGAAVRSEVRSRDRRRTLYVHAPARVEYRIRVPEEGRLDLGMGVLHADAPVTFRVSVTEGQNESEALFEETHADQEHWAQRSLDLSHLAGKTLTLTLEAESDRAGAVALWAAPTLSGERGVNRPNVIFYIIDGAAADNMSVYGYNRRTTPNLERLAAQGAVFERAYSNSTWTKPSTASFMTSLHSSVLGGIRGMGPHPVPINATTMAEHMHSAGYQTAVFTSNPQAGSLSNLERGVDVFRDAPATLNAASSAELHADFWKWREAYPGEPYWVHFQTTDLHPMWDQTRDAVAPFAGLYSSAEAREAYYEWNQQLAEAAGFTHAPWLSPDAFERTGIDYSDFFNAARSLYDETMAHQDFQIGQLVERLQQRGEWEHTLLIVAADHAGAAAHLPDPFPPRWGPMFNASVTRVPLIVVWPEQIAPGQRFSQPVSMIDVLPTILSLAGLPMPEILQGQSLTPLLFQEEGWEPRPVVLDEFAIDDSGELSGYIEVIDGRWGASLLINPSSSTTLMGAVPDIPKSREGDGYELTHRRPAALFLYDLWSDPYAQHSLHEDRPKLVEEYTRFLEAQWEAHQLLAQRFSQSTNAVLTPEQLETLRSLGYIQ